MQDDEGDGKKHWMGCLFPSKACGEPEDPAKTTLKNAEKVTGDSLKKQIANAKKHEDSRAPVG